MLSNILFYVSLIAASSVYAFVPGDHNVLDWFAGITVAWMFVSCAIVTFIIETRYMKLKNPALYINVMMQLALSYSKNQHLSRTADIVFYGIIIGLFAWGHAFIMSLAMLYCMMADLSHRKIITEKMIRARRNADAKSNK